MKMRFIAKNAIEEGRIGQCSTEKSFLCKIKRRGYDLRQNRCLWFKWNRCAQFLQSFVCCYRASSYWSLLVLEFSVFRSFSIDAEDRFVWRCIYALSKFRSKFALNENNIPKALKPSSNKNRCFINRLISKKNLFHNIISISITVRKNECQTCSQSQKIATKQAYIKIN